MGVFERYLSVWVGLAMLAGIGLGKIAPSLFSTIQSMEVAGVNLVVAVLIWLMVYPMMLKVDVGCIADIRKRPQGIVLILVVNWLIKPFTMAALGVLFFRVFFAGIVDPDDANQYIAGMILLGIAPCTAMVFVWSHLSRGDANYTLVQVSINDIILVFAFAPLAALLLGVTDLVVPWPVLVASVAIFVVIPLVAGLVSRSVCMAHGGEDAVEKLATGMKPWSVVGLILTVVILFGLQADAIVANPLPVVLIAIPLLIQTYGIFAITYGAAWAMKLRHDVAAPAGFIGSSNFFELAVAVAITVFPMDSGAALATVVGVLIEVPVMLSLVAFANRTRHWFPTAAPA